MEKYHQFFVLAEYAVVAALTLFNEAVVFVELAVVPYTETKSTTRREMNISEL